ncbi:hypothetical protein LINPERHAP2_LOCUS33866 [Linum perenne]
MHVRSVGFPMLNFVVLEIKGALVSEILSFSIKLFLLSNVGVFCTP